MLTELAPYRETGYRLLMEALARARNVAEAPPRLQKLRVLLREELGIAPAPPCRAIHQRLLQSADAELLGLREDVPARHVANAARGANAIWLACSSRARRRRRPG